jgi:hypothetical protein
MGAGVSVQNREAEVLTAVERRAAKYTFIEVSEEHIASVCRVNRA